VEGGVFVAPYDWQLQVDAHYMGVTVECSRSGGEEEKGASPEEDFNPATRLTDSQKKQSPHDVGQISSFPGGIGGKGRVAARESAERPSSRDAYQKPLNKKVFLKGSHEPSVSEELRRANVCYSTQSA